MTQATTLSHLLLSQQRSSLNFYFDHLNEAEVEKVLQLALECKGALVWTGAGKSGIIAEKVSKTLTSVGCRSQYLPAMDLLHGDIGGLGPDDQLYIFSKSGETRELLELIPHARKKGSKIVAIVSEPNSALAGQADLVVHLPVEKELCPFDLAPTISTATQLLFGDLLAMTWMREKGTSIEDYAENHPLGAIGRKITHTVADLMLKGEALPICQMGDRLIDVMEKLTSKRCGCLLAVSDEIELDGIFTDGDLRRALQKDGAHAMEKKVGDYLNRDPIVVQPDLLAHTALLKMQSKRYVMTAPVISEGKLVGLIRMHDIVHKEW